MSKVHDVLVRRVPVWVIVLTVYLSAAIALAQIAPSPVHPSSSGFAGGTVGGETTFSSQIRIADGTAAEPSLVLATWDDGTGTGLFNGSGSFNVLGVSANGTAVGGFSSLSGGHLALLNGQHLGWTSSLGSNNHAQIQNFDSASDRLGIGNGTGGTSVGIINGTVFTNGGTGAVSNTVTETTIINTASGIGTTVEGTGLNAVGKTLRVHAMGNITTDAVAPGTLQLRIKLGGVTIVDSGANTLTAVGTTARFWEYDALITTRVTGASGTVFAQGGFKYHTGVLAAAFEAGANTAASSAIDLGVDQTFDFTVQWGTADVDNVFNCTNLVVEILN